MVQPHQSESESDFTYETAAKIHVGSVPNCKQTLRVKSLLFGVADKLEIL